MLPSKLYTDFYFCHIIPDIFFYTALKTFSYSYATNYIPIMKNNQGYWRVFVENIWPIRSDRLHFCPYYDMTLLRASSHTCNILIDLCKMPKTMKTQFHKLGLPYHAALSLTIKQQMKSPLPSLQQCVTDFDFRLY